MTKKEIYLDHASTTYLDEEVFKEMEPYFSKNYGNPGSLHYKGLESKEALERAREKVAGLIGSDVEEIVFTSGGTESINLAIKGVALTKGKGHIITTTVEHPAVLETCRFLEKKGFKVTYLDVDKDGIVSVKEVEKALRKDTILVSIIYANNEIGTINPVAKIGRVLRKKGILFHTDACQAGGALNINVKDLDVDLMTLNGSKIYGPKGIGLLYVKKGVKLEPLIHGGGQENGLISGTENIPGIIGFAKALELGQQKREEENGRLVELRDRLVTGVLEKISKTFLNGHPTERLPNNANISFLDVEGESILLHLNEKEIYVSTGSACSSKELEISHVLNAIGLKADAAHGSIRFSLGKRTTKGDIDYVLKVLPGIIESLRRLSPVHLEEVRK
ncbi:IscS subfamily cysteine desulfurase [Candidatus Woesearchaeota archaeon]|nr:IscS subfamily cysteine desulfurase [Candidatus Woesearchaeota archaeon]